MIKRRFYKQDHGDKSGSSDSSSSDDSDSGPEVEVEEDYQVKADEYQEEGKGSDDKALRYPSPGSGYESEDSSNNQEENDASGLLTNEDEGSHEVDLHCSKDSKTISNVVDGENDSVPGMTEMMRDPNHPFEADASNFILKCKSIFKCRLCPRVLCLNEDTLRAHLTSKRHARSKKLFGEGRLKLMLNSDGEIEEEQETHSERHARILALAQEPAVLNTQTKKMTGRHRQSYRRKKRMRSSSKKENPEAFLENATKKKRRSVD